jgi:hypothetical protein
VTGLFEAAVFVAKLALYPLESMPTASPPTTPASEAPVKSTVAVALPL